MSTKKLFLSIEISSSSPAFYETYIVKWIESSSASIYSDEHYASEWLSKQFVS